MATIITYPKDGDSETFVNLGFTISKEKDQICLDIEHRSGEHFNLILLPQEVEQIAAVSEGTEEKHEKNKS